MFVVLAMTSTPIGAIHTHAEGDHDHDHAHWAQLADDGSAEQAHDDDPEAPTDPGVLHAHDAGTTSSAVPAIELVTLDEYLPVIPTNRLAPGSPPSAALTPPQRPPIA